MKRLIASVIVSTIAFVAIAEDTPMFDPNKGEALEQDLAEGKIYGSLKHMVKDKANKMRLVGKAYLHTPKDKILEGNTYALIGWLGVQKADAVDKVVAFKEPIVSSFVFKNGTNIKNVSLPTFGEQSYLTQAINDLEQDKIDYEDLKKPRKIKFPVGQNDKNAFWLVSNKGAKQVKTGKKMQDLKGIEPSNNPVSVNDLANNENSSNQNSNHGSSNNNLNFSGNSSGHSLPNFQSDANNETNKGKPNKNKNTNNNKLPKNNNNPSGNNEHNGHGNPNGGNQNSNSNNPSDTHYRDAENMDLFVVLSIDENNPPTTGDAVVITNAPNGRRAYLVRNGRYVRNGNGELVSVPVDTNTDNLQTDYNGRVQRNGENSRKINQVVNGILTNLAQNNDELDFGPEITVELTEEGCNPEHDVLQERVFITARAKKSENGRIIEEGVCERTLEFYPIKKDYVCEQCVDEINNQDKVAYALYMEHWFDREGSRHNLGIKADKELPFKLIEESKGCPFDTESEVGFAIKTSKLGYLNKFGVFKTVEECRVIENSDQYPVRLTDSGCDLIHDLTSNTSQRQKRVVFNKNGREYEAKGCQTTETLNHEFITDLCNPLSVSHFHGVALTQGIRAVRIDGSLKQITNQCEPIGEVQVDGTYEGCENIYSYHTDIGWAYLHKRFFYTLPSGEIRYVTQCVKTNDYVEATEEWSGEYEHHDEQRFSYKKTGMWITHPANGTKILVEFGRVRDGADPVPHINRDGGWERPDGSFYAD